MIDTTIFKAYDIRGTYPEQLNEPLAIAIGKAFATFLKPKKVLVARDMRPSSPAMSEAVIQGLISQGVDVVDIGMASTPMFNYAVASDDSIDGGIMVTASHNPAGYNGMKMVRGDVMPIGKGYGMDELRDLVVGNNFIDVDDKGSVEYKEIFEDFVEKVFSLVDIASIKPMTIAIDAGNGVTGPFIHDLFWKIPQVRVHEMYFEPDGTFPNHEANPIKPETLEDLKNRVLTHNAPVGFALDGDGDRLGIVDELGNVLPGDVITALLARQLLQRPEYKGTLMHYDLRCSWIVPETIEEHGGKSEPCMVGHALIKNLMKRDGAVFAGELSNHFYFKDFYKVECASLVMLLILQMLSETDQPLSSLVAPLKKYFQSGEINSEVDDKEGVMKKLEEMYKDGATSVSWLDGIKIEHDDYWFNVRPSNTEPLLRLNLEAKTEERMVEMRDEILNVIRGGV